MGKYAIITDSKHLQNKQIDYRYYLIFVKNTYLNNSSDNYKILNTETFFEKDKLEEIIKKMDIKKETFDKGIRKFLKTDLVDVVDDDILIKVKDDNSSFYQLLNDEEINELLKLSSTDIKIYLIIKYLMQYNTGEDIKNLKLKTISEKIGFSTTNNKSILKSIKILKDNNLIDYYTKKSKKITNGKILKYDKYYFKLIHNNSA